MNYAGFWPRLMAHNIDLMILLPMYYLCSLFISSNMIMLIFCFAVSYLYESMLVFHKGGTIGKRMMKLKVVNDQGLQVSLVKSLVRSLVKIPSALSFFIGFAVIGLHAQKKGIHDILSGTFVIISSDN